MAPEAAQTFFVRTGQVYGWRHTFDSNALAAYNVHYA
jgi:hypothetical protein